MMLNDETEANMSWDKYSCERLKYSDEKIKDCRSIILSDKACTSILQEAMDKDPLETGGLLLGQVSHGRWYVVEATGPGINAVHTNTHNEMDNIYHNHIFPVLSRQYKKELFLLGLWHRHPGSLDRFSFDDDRTNRLFSEAVGKAMYGSGADKRLKSNAVSMLLNFDPVQRMTGYYCSISEDEEGALSYHRVPVSVGNRYFRRTGFLQLKTPADI